MIQGELLAHALGASDDAARERIDAHLLTCTECLRAYLRLKHHVERGASLERRPSDEVRRRIRAEVAVLVRPTRAERLNRWLRRPIPLYQGLAVAAVAAGVALAGPWIKSAVPVGSRSAERSFTEGDDQVAALHRVDTSRPVAASQTAY
ncbi:MAG TPA: hypothetical protein VGI39_29760 [Polyangiaceae bacterium]|jgi:anti-sigma factor RsiW